MWGCFAFASTEKVTDVGTPHLGSRVVVVTLEELISLVLFVRHYSTSQIGLGRIHPCIEHHLNTITLSLLI